MLFRKPAATGAVDFLIVGLGNPDKKYEGTRHNAGFMVLEALGEALGVRINRVKFKAFCGEAVIGDKKCLLMMPQTYMNNSGEAVREALAFYKLPPERCLVVCDDISLPVGTIRIRRKGSDGGQRGMRSIITLCGSDQFGKVMFHTVCPLSMVDVIITDEGIKKEMKEALEERGIKVIVAAADA